MCQAAPTTADDAALATYVHRNLYLVVVAVPISSSIVSILRKLIPATTVELAAELGAVVQMSLPRMVRGFVRSAERLRMAIEAESPDDVYTSLFEASTWLDSLDERCKLRDGSQDIQALRLVQQGTHHNWAAAASPPVPGASQEWYWRPLDNLPQPDPQHPKPELERAYRKRLEGQPIIGVFERLLPEVEKLAA